MKLWHAIISILLITIGIMLIASASRTAVLQEKVNVASVENCLEVGGRIAKIDGYKGCFELKVVPDSELNSSFFNFKTARRACAAILNAKWMAIDGYLNCFYFKRIKLETIDNKTGKEQANESTT